MNTLQLPRVDDRECAVTRVANGRERARTAPVLVRRLVAQRLTELRAPTSASELEIGAKSRFEANQPTLVSFAICGVIGQGNVRGLFPAERRAP